MKIALVHDHLAQDGGAEKVLQALQAIWPEAPTYVIVHDPQAAHPAFRNKDIRTSFLQKWPGGVKHYQWFFPLMPSAVESYDLSHFDVVLSSTASYAKGVITRPETLHISYCHTPTRYLWSDTHSYVQELGASRFVKWMLPFFLSYVRVWDKMAAERVDRFIANSKVVQNRIHKYYKVPSDVIYPPVDTNRFEIGTPSDYYLAGGRLVPYKRFDLVVAAFNRLGRKLKIYGTGPELSALQSQAKTNIEFVGKVSDTDLAKLYQGALAFINPQIEDFGITMVEAMASGRPVIAYAAGGAQEIVLAGETGEFFYYQTWEDLADAVVRFKPEQYQPSRIRARAEEFSLPVFTKAIQQYVEDALAHFTPNH
ncbi:MAG: glycosyltransferase [Candidatus Kerfeldbacteria bacterium]|nr:glycosyltransferase [Candidatus Kerfeldbacteria bacterium]